MLALRKSQTWNEGNLEGFRPHRHLPRPAPRPLCAGGPLGACFSVIPVALPDLRGTIPQGKRLPVPPATSHQSQITKSFTIRTSAKHASNPFGIRTSKTQDLKPFRMNTSEKTPGGCPRAIGSFCCSARPSPSRHSSRDNGLRHGQAILPSTFNLRLSTLQVQSPHVIPGDR